MDVVCPRPLDPAQGTADTIDLGGAKVLFVELSRDLLFQIADVADHVQGLFGQADAYRAAVVGRALLIEIAHLGKLLDVVGDVRSLVVAALDQVADGDLLGSVLGGGRTGSASGRTSGGGSTAGMAILATIAMAALKNWTDNRREQASMAGAAAGFAPEDLETMTAPDTEALIVRAMASAAKADGRIEEDEVQRIVGKVGADGLSEEEKQFLISELRAPLDLAALVADVPNEMVAAEVYAASLLAIDLDTQEEVAYLRQLAQALRLDGATVARLHQITGATPV